ncbi:MAG: hypothetical protein HYY81_10135 [Deltaproteobacteria bacterium]|nr:hypothetical protein [Deltaproteobacteria bacterium]
MLKVTIVHQGQRLSIFHAEEKNQAEIGARPNAVFIFGLKLAFTVPYEHIRLHTDCKNAQLPGDALHRAPAIVMGLLRYVKVDPWAVTGALFV